MSTMLPAVQSFLGTLPFRRSGSEFKRLRDYYKKYHSYDLPDDDNVVEATYTVIDSDDVKSKITDYLGKVLARCWIDPTLLDRLDAEPRQTLLELGIVLPYDLNLRVKRSMFSKRPRLVVYEVCPDTGREKRVCFIELIMRAGR